MPEETKEVPKSRYTKSFLGQSQNKKSSYNYLNSLKRLPTIEKKAENSMKRFNMFLDDQAKRQL